MPLQHPPRRGAILLCDYGLGGFKKPEMIKKRPAVVISPRRHNQSRLATVVALSKAPNDPPDRFGIEVRMPPEVPEPFNQPECWAKCDMVNRVGLKRLDLFRSERAEDGRRQYIDVALSNDELAEIVSAVAASIGLRV